MANPAVVAFFLAVVFGGVNPIAIQFSNQELQPLFGAALRFAAAAVVFVVYLGLRRIRLPTGSGLLGAVGFGAMVAGANALAYWAILHVPPAIVAVFLAATPLLTMFLAAAHRLETLQVRGLAGGLLAVLGIVVLQNPDFGIEMPPLALLAVIGATVLAAEAGIVVKKYPSHHPAATNGLATLVGAGVLFAASAIAGDTWLFPARGETWLALAHLAVLGTVGMFALYLFVLKRWSASRTSYATVLMPVVTVVLAALLLDQTFTWGMALAAALVLAGVFVGALWRPTVPVPAPPAEEALAKGCSFT
jgi:drug/metabolite transporter (DMT)-like permease